MGKRDKKKNKAPVVAKPITPEESSEDDSDSMQPMEEGPDVSEPEVEEEDMEKFIKE